jgi:phosphomannomutase
MSAFHAYDIRAIYGAGIDETLAFRTGRAFGRFTKAPRVLGGYDARSHSNSLYRAFAAGLADVGVEVVGAGLVTTPALHYLQMTLGYPAGFMATASHNPPQYHGFKLYDGVGGSISYAKGLAEIESLVAEDRSTPPASPPEPEALASAASDDYVAFASSPLDGAPRAASATRVVVDTSSGSAGALVARACRRMGLDADLLNAEPDGTFPSHPPNPLDLESQRQTSARVVASGAAFGAILDGDGDRIIFVDDRGETVPSSFAGALIARELLEQEPGGAVVYDLISSRVFPEVISESGGKPIKSKVGYTHLYDQMFEHGALYGNEASGHVYFRVSDHFSTESAIYALAVIVRLVERAERPLSELVAPLRRRYVQLAERNIPLTGDEPVADVLGRVRAAFADAEIDELDGISVSYDRYWFNVRPSNTEPLLRLRLEAVDEAAANAGSDRVLAAVQGGP